jgi:hypothetical protein
MSDVPLSEQITEVKREMALRRRVYPNWIAAGRLTHPDADRQLGRMAAALATLERLEEVRRDAEEPKLI